MRTAAFFFSQPPSLWFPSPLLGADRSAHASADRRATTQADIERLTKVLEQERIARQQKEQYTALAKRIHSYPSRADTQAEIAQLNEEITGLKRRNDELEDGLAERSKRFAGFMHALHDVQQLLQMEEKAKVEAAPAAE